MSDKVPWYRAGGAQPIVVWEDPRWWRWLPRFMRQWLRRFVVWRHLRRVRRGT